MISDTKTKIFVFLLPENFKGFSHKIQAYGRSLIFSVFFVQWWGFEFTAGRGSPANVNVRVMTNQDCTKVKNVTFEFFFRILKLFRQFQS